MAELGLGDHFHDELLFEPLEEEDEDDVKRRFEEIRHREQAAVRSWRSLPEHSQDLSPETVRCLELGKFGSIAYRVRTWPPPKGCDIVVTGGVLWDAALVLCKYMERETDRALAFSHESKMACVSSVVGRRVIELGAGLGLPSLVAQKLGAKEVVATDMAVNLDLLRQNIGLNITTGDDIGDVSLHATALCWGDSDVIGALTAPGKFDTILCSDVIYNDCALSPLTETILALSGLGTIVLTCCEHRFEGAPRFYALLEEVGFEVSAVPWTEMHQTYRHETIHLYRSVLTKPHRPSPTN
eukprot:TRINITY_DN77197_c0_g1_i1.p1 TRINITY_DN77197_c0_g1~~TRINITY_DN77197_c0_g1_i1.p1  ORF type:complete len:298 (-),score=47.45 TRINITY_DN77197_c0_g1_i1:23-916(-)